MFDELLALTRDVSPALGRAELTHLPRVTIDVAKARSQHAEYERAIASDATQAVPRRNLAILLDLYLNQPAAALEHYEKSLALANGSDTDINGWLVELRGRLGQTQRTAETKP